MPDRLREWLVDLMHPGNTLAVESWAAVVDRPDADEDNNSTVDNTHEQG